jgi:hypothetical protein
MAKQTRSKDANPDPITGEPGAHPVGAGAGAAIGGAAAGAAAGAVAGPVGAVAGAAIGGIAGGYAGKAIEESIDPTAEDAYWRENFSNQDYIEDGSDYETYRPAYQYGWESRGQFAGRRFDDVEPELQRNWPRKRGQSTMAWEQAKRATRDAWDHVEMAIPGDADRDGK